MSRLKDVCAIVAEDRGLSFVVENGPVDRDFIFVRFNDGAITFPIEITALELLQNDAAHLRDLIETRLTLKQAEWKRFAQNAARPLERHA